MPASDPGIRVLTTPPSGCAEILEPAALQFLGALARRFEPERQRRLAHRRERQQELDAGRLPDFLPETKEIRDRDWTVAPIRPDLTVDGQPISASLFDFGLTFFHTATKLAASGSGPYFYLPKLESHLEARLWNDVFVFAQDALGIPRGTIRATVLIETILAAFET